MEKCKHRDIPDVFRKYMTDDPINYPRIKLTTGICPLLTWTHMHMNAVLQIHPVIKLPVKDKYSK